MKEHKQLMKIAFTGLMAALSYVVFTFLQIRIPLPGGDATSIHLGNAICVLGALLLGGLYGGLGGAIGMTIGHITKETDNRKVWKWVILAAAAGLLFNVIFDPLIGYLYKLLILGKPAAELTLAWNVTATSINAVTSTIVSSVVYMALRPALKKAGLFMEL